MDSKLESMAAVDGRLQSGWQMRHKIPGNVEARHHWPRCQTFGRDCVWRSDELFRSLLGGRFFFRARGRKDSDHGVVTFMTGVLVNLRVRV